MYSFEFDHISLLEDHKVLSKGLYLCVWHADKIPPHIGIIVDGLYFSLKVKGKDIDLPYQDILKLIHKKKICALFVEWKEVYTKEEVKNRFESYVNAAAGSVSCLSPMIALSALENEINILADFLHYFSTRKQIGQVFGLNLTSDFKGIRSYGIEEIDARLQQLKAKKKEKC